MKGLFPYTPRKQVVSSYETYHRRRNPVQQYSGIVVALGLNRKLKLIAVLRLWNYTNKYHLLIGITQKNIEQKKGKSTFVTVKLTHSEGLSQFLITVHHHVIIIT
jgi:hypothetical protein